MLNNPVLSSIAFVVIATVGLTQDGVAKHLTPQTELIYGRWALDQATDCQEEVDGLHIDETSYKAYVDGKLFFDRDVIDISFEKIDEQNMVIVAAVNPRAGSTHVEFFEIINSDTISLRYFVVYEKNKKVRETKEYNPGADLARCP